LNPLEKFSIEGPHRISNDAVVVAFIVIGSSVGTLCRSQGTLCLPRV